MRFLGDMCVDVRVIEWLRSVGHDAVHLREEQLHRLPDGEVFVKGRAEGRIVLTLDLDFGEIAAFSKGEHASVILFRLHNTRFAHVIRRLAAVLEQSRDSLEKGAVIVVEESRHRVRYLPIGETGA